MLKAIKVNIPPINSFLIASNLNKVVTFDAANSIDLDEQIAIYFWNLRDGTHITIYNVRSKIISSITYHTG